MTNDGSERRGATRCHKTGDIVGHDGYRIADNARPGDVNEGLVGYQSQSASGLGDKALLSRVDRRLHRAQIERMRRWGGRPKGRALTEDSTSAEVNASRVHDRRMTSRKLALV